MIDFLKRLFAQITDKISEFIFPINAFNDNNLSVTNLMSLNSSIVTTRCYILIIGFLSESTNHRKI